MEQTLITGLLLSLIGGLGWLACHYPQFAIKATIVLLASSLLLHFFIKMYQRGWHKIYSFDKTIDGIFLILEAAFAIILLFAVAFQKYIRQ